jgi:hypothetical protein
MEWTIWIVFWLSWVSRRQKSKRPLDLKKLRTLLKMEHTLRNRSVQRCISIMWRRRRRRCLLSRRCPPWRVGLGELVALLPMGGLLRRMQRSRSPLPIGRRPDKSPSCSL